MQHARLANQPAFAHPDMIVELDFQRRAPETIVQRAEQRAAHRGIGERVGDAAVRDALRIEMPRGLDIDRHRAAPVSAFDHLQAERAGEFEILPERPHRTLLRSEEHTSELQSLMRNSYAVFCLKKKKKTQRH